MVLLMRCAGELVCLPKCAAIPITLRVLEYEVFTVSPIKKFAFGASFAPIGLLKMFNAGGAIQTLDYQLNETRPQVELLEKPRSELEVRNQNVEETIQVSTATIRMRVHGQGEFGAYSSVKPRNCLLDCVITEFTYEAQSGLVKITLPSKCGLQDVVIEV